MSSSTLNLTITVLGARSAGAFSFHGHLENHFPTMTGKLSLIKRYCDGKLTDSYFPTTYECWINDTAGQVSCLNFRIYLASNSCTLICAGWSIHSKTGMTIACRDTALPENILKCETTPNGTQKILKLKQYGRVGGRSAVVTLPRILAPRRPDSPPGFSILLDGSHQCRVLWVEILYTRSAFISDAQFNNWLLVLVLNPYYLIRVLGPKYKFL